MTPMTTNLEKAELYIMTVVASWNQLDDVQKLDLLKKSWDYITSEMNKERAMKA